MGPSWSRLGAVLGRLGRPRGCHGAVLSRLGAVLGRPGVILGSPGAVLSRPGAVPGRPWAVMWPAWAGPPWVRSGAVLSRLDAVLGLLSDCLGSSSGRPGAAQDENSQRTIQPTNRPERQSNNSQTRPGGVRGTINTARWVLRHQGAQNNPISSQAIVLNTLGVKPVIWGAQYMVWADLNTEPR